MHDCDYCEASFDEETAYFEHLRDDHFDELGPIDRRRLDEDETDDGVATGILVLGGVLIFAVLLVGYLALFVGGPNPGADQSAGGPTNVGSVHYHGTIELLIENRSIDFTRSEFKRPGEFPAFHFEGTNDPRWHVHAQGVTLEYAMDSLGIHVTNESVTFDGTTYRQGPETTVSVRVNDRPVDPSKYVLQPEGHVRIVVRAR